MTATCFVTYELSKLGRFNEEYEMARTGGGNGTGLGCSSSPPSLLG